jgi:hypothetical protein
VISIVPFRGRNIFVENRIEDAGAFQPYGSAADVIVADNVMARSDGILAWGLTQHGWGWHPVLRCQILGNALSAGSGYGERVSGPAAIAVATTGNNEQYQGPLARAVVIRGNSLTDQAIVSVDGTVVDVIIEKNTVSHSPQGVRIGKDPTGVFIRDNTFEDVHSPVTGDGATRAYKE